MVDLSYFYLIIKKIRVSLPEFVWVIDKGMQSFKKIYSVIMKLNRFFALHFFANDLYCSVCIEFTAIKILFKPIDFGTINARLSMTGLRPRLGNLRLVFRVFRRMRGLPSIRVK